MSYGGTATSFAASITGIKYWNGTSYVATCPSADAGLQLVALRIESSDHGTVEAVETVKRRP